MMTSAVSDALQLLRPLPAGAFDARPVPVQTVEAVLEIAARAPSGTNTQPWNVVAAAGAARDRIARHAMLQAQALVHDAGRREAFWQACQAHPLARGWCAEPPVRGADPRLAAALAHDGGGSVPALRDYFDFHGAPMALFILLHEQLGVGSVLDMGMFLQNLVLAAQARGLRAEVQTGWRGMADAGLREALGCGEDHSVLCAVALGWDAGSGDTPLPAAPDVAGAIRWQA